MAGCSGGQEETGMDYKQISQEEAKEIMANENGCIILDVRTQEEFAEWHIHDAICIPVETITDTQPEELPNLDQKIFDSDNADVSDTHLILLIRNFTNDSYCRDISMKVKSSKEVKRKNGEFIGSFAPFGYKKDDKNKHQLVVDRKVAHIIERKFNIKIEGYSSKAIADFLNSIGTVTPSKHKVDVSKEDWIAIENAHESIISKSIFALANKMPHRDVK